MRSPDSFSRLLLSTLIAAAAACAQSYTLGLPSPGDNPGELQVRVTAKSGKSVPFDAVSNPAAWRVTVYRKNGAAISPEFPKVTEIRKPALYDALGIVILATDATYALNADLSALAVEVDFFGGAGVVTALYPADGVPKVPAIPNPAPKPSSDTSVTSTDSGSKTGCGALTPAQQVDRLYLNYCFSGIWVPQVGSHPLYSTNSNFTVADSWHGATFGIDAQEAADSSVLLDPNAFSSAIFFQKFLAERTPVPHLMSVILNWDLARAEFDRKKKNSNLGTNVNLITAPQLEFPFSFGRFGLEFDAGIEAGHNYKNNIDPNGFGTVFRGVPGVQLERIYVLKSGALKKVKILSQYQARILAENEVITRSIHGKLMAYEGRQTRNWVSTEFDFMFSDNFGLTLKHDYGALPPGFVFIENRATVGFTFQSSK